MFGHDWVSYVLLVVFATSHFFIALVFSQKTRSWPRAGARLLRFCIASISILILSFIYYFSLLGAMAARDVSSSLSVYSVAVSMVVLVLIWLRYRSLKSWITSEVCTSSFVIEKGLMEDFKGLNVVIRSSTYENDGYIFIEHDVCDMVSGELIKKQTVRWLEIGVEPSMMPQKEVRDVLESV